MRIFSEVTAEDCRPALLDIDPAAPGYGTHLPFYLILQRCGVAWRAFLRSLDGFGDGVIVPHLRVDFLAEVRVGAIEIAVEPVEVGTTSLTVRCTVRQRAAEAARVDVVLVSYDYQGGIPVPLTEAQRASLQPNLNSIKG